MRVQKSDVIAGLPAPVARAVLRKFNRREAYAEELAPVLSGLDVEVESALPSLVQAGLIEFVKQDLMGDDRWVPTMAGNALAMASFGKPITRATADRLLAEVLDRAVALNADPRKIVRIERIRVFGSYLDPSVERLGDLDLELRVARRPDASQSSLEYAIASGRRFASSTQQLMWPREELARLLRNRSTAINITLEDVSTFTDRVRTVFEIDRTDAS